MRLAPLLVALLSSVSSAAENWPSFRGPLARGVSDGENLPGDWDVRTGRNVRFKVPIPGLGHSSPIVWGERVFLTSAVGPAATSLQLGDTGGIDMSTGRRIWTVQRDERPVWSTPTVHDAGGRKGCSSWAAITSAATTPATDASYGASRTKPR